MGGAPGGAICLWCLWPPGQTPDRVWTVSSGGWRKSVPGITTPHNSRPAQIPCMRQCVYHCRRYWRATARCSGSGLTHLKHQRGALKEARGSARGQQ